MNSRIESTQTQTPSFFSPSSSSSNSRVVVSVEDLVFYTNTDESSYPIYVDANRKLWIKTKPFEVVKDEYGVERKRRLNVPVVATFYVKRVEEASENTPHELLEKAVDVVKEVTMSSVTVKRLVITYEVYAGEMDRLLGEAKAYAIKVMTAYTPYSGVKYSGRKAWAIGYEWKKRIVAKAPELEKYVYLKGEEGRKERAYVRVIVKLPVPTQELVNLFNLALGTTTATTDATTTADIEKQIAELERLIEQKRAELRALEEQLHSLKSLKTPR